jgi:hypothetical protein
MINVKKCIISIIAQNDNDDKKYFDYYNNSYDTFQEYNILYKHLKFSLIKISLIKISILMIT